MIAQLKDLASKAEPAEKTLVLRRCTRYAEAPVPIDLDAAIFEQWLDGYRYCVGEGGGGEGGGDGEVGWSAVTVGEG